MPTAGPASFRMVSRRFWFSFCSSAGEQAQGAGIVRGERLALHRHFDQHFVTAGLGLGHPLLEIAGIRTERERHRRRQLGDGGFRGALAQAQSVDHHGDLRRVPAAASCPRLSWVRPDWRNAAAVRRSRSCPWAAGPVPQGADVRRPPPVRYRRWPADRSAPARRAPGRTVSMHRRLLWARLSAASFAATSAGFAAFRRGRGSFWPAAGALAAGTFAASLAAVTIGAAAGGRRPVAAASSAPV